MENLFEKVVALAKRRGFAYPSSEIYGGMANTWDFGPLGTLLKNNIRDSWWSRFVIKRNDMVGIDASVFLNPKVWEASGHLTSFTDAMVDCKNCHNRTRADHLIEDFLSENAKKLKNDSYITEKITTDELKASFESGKVEGWTPGKMNEFIKIFNVACPSCHVEPNQWTDVRKFNLLFETSIGILEGSKSKAYLRGEIAQGIFLNFQNVINTNRVKVPFGIAQQGKAFRNEITMGQFLHRTLEFDLMEFEYFIKETDWERTFEMWRKEMWEWIKDLGINKEKLRWREHEEFERSHYSKKTMDIEYNYPFGWKEMFGIAYRTSFDLSNHAKHSSKDLNYTDPESGEKFIPHVVEPTFGLSRLVGIVLFDAYREEEKEDKKRIYLKLSPKLAPVKAAVFPLLANKPDLIALAKKIYENLQENIDGKIAWDDRGNIGKRYLSQDEVGTPFCITVDFQSLEDKTVTIRHRDTAIQERIKIVGLEKYLQEKLN